MTLKLKILGIPQPKQSARFRIQKTVKKSFVRSYQKVEVIQNERNIAFDVKSQLPTGFIPFNTALKVKVTFIFPPLKNWTKKKLDALEAGTKFYKTTKPDLTDNLMKGTMDAMNGIVFTDDAVIAKVESEKIFGTIPRIEIEFEKL
ncbi:hypothetical protein CHRYSEOSP005_11840 [Chryseobacterium sp. Alg-005]|uniref:RusA family crossover junction endodeoxyribonuclease n=1 Tax=Chryseobacterium sp. Alg-005 TaxID=3159516 RepID=UPI0035558148